MDSNQSDAVVIPQATPVGSVPRADDKFFLPGISYEQFLDTDILELMGAKGLSDEEKKEMYQTMVDTIQDRVIIRLFENMSDEDYDRLENSIDAKDSRNFEEVIEKNNIDLVQLFAEESLAYKIEMVNLANGPKTQKEE